MDQVETKTMARSEVDTTRPFQSVKEAVAVFGERISFHNSCSFKTTNPSSSPIGAKTNLKLCDSPKPIPIQSLSPSSIETDGNSNFDASPKPIHIPALENLNSSTLETNIKLKIDESPNPNISIPSPPQSYFSSPINKTMYSAQSSPRSFASSVSNSIENKEPETENLVFDYLKKLEQEVAETKKEVITLKKRENEMELMLATLNAQLNKNLSKLAQIEAVKQDEISEEREEKLPYKVRSNRWDEESVNNGIRNYEYLPSFREALSLGDLRDDIGFEIKRNVQKMKPIVPLVGDIFKKKKSLKHNNSFYSPSIYSMLS
ncbi:hypothetical protein LUZ60_004262 [Juncus effusus]|nr:hypothetical protein LUZ60_004262 [Juncus effusus]